MALSPNEPRRISVFETLSARPAHSGFVMASTAVRAILRRDLVVTWRELIAFLIQVLIQPLFLLFSFGKVLPGIGFASSSFGAVLLPGIVGFTLILTAFAGASLGLTLGTLIQAEHIGLMFSLIFTPLIFLGCTYYPWGTLDSIRWFQILTLLNPLTYASEGLRNAMVPVLHGKILPTLGIGWVLLGLGATVVFFSILGIRMFSRRVVN
jgi:ABC-2 type transport system permease protein